MNIQKILTAPIRGLKALRDMVFPRLGGWLSWDLPRTKFNYKQEVGDGLGASVIMAPVLWIARTFPEAPVLLEQMDTEGEYTQIPEHDFLTLMRKPNPFYSAPLLWMGTLISFTMDGNGYWIKIRSRAGKVVQTWYCPHFLMEPKSLEWSDAFIDYYEYSPGNRSPIRLDPEDVVHFRYGIDPRNTRKGLSPMYPVLREVFTDLEASNFSAAMLRNLGIPGVVMSPKEAGMKVDAEAMKEKYMQKFGGDRRGEPYVATAPVDIEQLGFSAKDMDLSKLRNLSEERTCAMLGIPAAVVGFGTGLQQTKVGATMKELRELAYENNIVPTQRLFGEDLKTQLLSDFVETTQLDRYRVGFDIREVRVLQDDMNDRSKRTVEEYQGGLITRAEGRETLGRQSTEADNIYLQKLTVTEVPSGGKSSALVPGRNGRKTNGQIHWKADEEGHLPTELIDNMIEALDRDRKRLQAGFEERLTRDFHDLGKEVSATAAALPGLAREEIERTVFEILKKFDVEDWMEKRLKPTYEKEYLHILTTTIDSVQNTLGLSFEMPDMVAKEILKEGGRRLGLLDLTQDTKDKLFSVIAEAREAGEGIPAIVRRIRNEVPAGPWSTSEIRAQVIARTEVKHAQRKSSLMAYKESGVIQTVMLFDGRIATSCEVCQARDGLIISFEEAEEYMAIEHPNGTMDFAPYGITPQMEAVE